MSISSSNLFLYTHQMELFVHSHEFENSDIIVMLNSECSLKNAFKNNTSVRSIKIKYGRITDLTGFCQGCTNLRRLEIESQIYRDVSFKDFCSGCVNLELIDMSRSDTDLFDCDFDGAFDGCDPAVVNIGKRVILYNKPDIDVKGFAFVRTDKKPYDYQKQEGYKYYVSSLRNQLEITKYLFNDTRTNTRCAKEIIPFNYYYLPADGKIDIELDDIMFKPFPNGI